MRHLLTLVTLVSLSGIKTGHSGQQSHQIFLAISPLQDRVSVACNVAGGGGVSGILFRCVSRCRLKLADVAIN